MDILSTLSGLAYSPRETLKHSSFSDFSRPGAAGHVAGALSIFVFLRINSVVPPGVFSFLALLAAVLSVNFLLASVIHLFLEMTGAPGSARRLFSLLGVGEFFWTLLVPFGFLCRFGYLSPFLWVSLCFIFVLSARVTFVRGLYFVSGNKALLAVWMPYALAAVSLLSALTYAVAWLAWLVF